MTRHINPQYLGRALAVALYLVLALGAAPALARDNAHAVGQIAPADLPQEGRETLALIKRGGPFRHRQDGSVFGNREKRLPEQARGYYREYTVPTPGAKDRGARRIVAGGEARSPGEFYYSDDHYNSFRRIRE
jgi:ribonuclease T1